MLRMRGTGLRFCQLRVLNERVRTLRAATGSGQRRWNSAKVSVSPEKFSLDVSRQRHSKLRSLHDEAYITSVLDAFLTLGMVPEAEPILNKFRREGHQFHVSVYNKMLQCWVKKGSKLRAFMLFDTMSRDGVEPDCQTYATMLVLCARHKDWETAKNIIRKMESKGYPLKHVFQTAKLSHSEAGDMLKVMDYFAVSPETAPRTVGPYPRVVQELYHNWQKESERERERESEREREKEEAEKEQDRQKKGMREERKIKEGNIQPVLSSSLDLLTSDELGRRLRKQLQVEQQGYLSVPSVAARATSENAEEEALKESTHQLMKQWHRDLAKAVRKDTEDFHTVIQHLPATGTRFFGPKQYPFLALLPAEVWADIVIEEVAVNILAQQHGLPVAYLCRLICESAWHKYVVAQKKERGVVKKTSSLYHHFVPHLCSPPPHLRPYREVWQEIDDMEASSGSLSVEIPHWPFGVASYVGVGLLLRLIDTAKLSLDDTDTGDEQAFCHSYEVGENGWQVGHIKAHKKLFTHFKKYYIKHESAHFRLSAPLAPMLIPPRPWTCVKEGGYFVTPASIMRCIADVYQHHLLLEKAPNLNAVFDSLNVLGACPWRINTKILDLVVDIFNSGGDEKLDVPVRDPVFPEELEGREPSRRRQEEMKKLQNECYSLWMDMLYRLSLANYFRDELFWLPHNMDFRGRVYPIPPHLSHLTSDVGRSLLQFGIGYPLGEKGLNWLKIHLVNLHGQKKKASLEERLAYADEMMEEIMDSADHPMEGRQWWQSGDDCWQVLACCMEVTAAIRSGDPQNYVSHIPVHQDGSCNGLQHYAALGRDWLGAKQVNLTPGERPEDPYSGVAAMVEEQRVKDAAEGHEIACKLEGKITRKVVKQTVMTVVYGVTWVGGRLQIAKQLRGEIPDEDLWNCSSYVVGEVFRALRQSFANARGIQDWLSVSARKVALAKRPMEWVTPLGLPVVQPYHKPKKKEVHTRLQNVFEHHTADTTFPPDTRKQKNAMPPNFVHSLDSTHMMLTALHSHQAGISFVAVHDSYWTHACFVDTMNRICREQFVTLHNEPILTELAEFWEVKFGGLTYRDMKAKNKKQKCQFTDPFPTIGDFDLSQVLESTYFFS